MVQLWKVNSNPAGQKDHVHSLLNVWTNGSWSKSNENDKTGICDRFFLITNFYMLKLWLTLMKKFGGGILKIKIKKERTVFVDMVAVCGSSNCVIKCG